MSATDINQSSQSDGTWEMITTSADNAGRVSAPVRTTGVNLAEVRSETRNGVSTPGYIDRAKYGRLPMNNFHYTKTTRLYQSGWKHTRVTSGKSYIDKVQSGVFDDSTSYSAVPEGISSFVKANLSNQCKQKVLAKIKDQDVNLHQIWAEREQTMRTVANAATRIGKAYSALKHGNFLGAAAALGISNPRTSVSARQYARDQSKAIARGWLELQYGWRPMISDVYGTLVAFEKAEAKRKEFVSVKSRKSAQDSHSLHNQINGGEDFVVWEASLDLTITAKYKRAIPVLISLTSLGLTNPAVIAWELTGFSFVVDWFLPIGSFLSQIDSTLGWQFSTAAETVFQKKSVTVTRAITSSGGYSIFVQNGFKKTEVIELDRTGYTGDLSLYSLPYLKNPMSFEHALNGMALLRTLKR